VARPLLTLAMIVRDEADVLDRCLASVAGVVDDVVVVDTGSADATVAVATGRGARVLHHDWDDDFAAARNVALDAVTTEWVLHLDADEELATAPAVVRELLEATPADALAVTMRNLSAPGDPLTHRDTPLVRLFRNRPAHRYRGRIHEHVATAVRDAGGVVAAAPEVLVVHHGYTRPTVQGGERRVDRNLRLLARAVADHPDDPHLLFQYGRELKQAERWDEAERALRAALRHDRGRLPRPVRGECHTRLAQVLATAQRWEPAAAEARHGLRLLGDDVATLHVLGISLHQAGRRTQAAPVLRALRDHPALDPAFRPAVDALLAS
jgi:tetratricopeptide (TPR) repeat protein